MSIHGRPDLAVGFPFMAGLLHHDWPYNVRELESAVRVAVTLSGGAPLDLLHLPETVRRALDGHGAPALPGPAQQANPGTMTMGTGTPPRRGDTPSEEELRDLLVRHRGNIAAVGRELGKERMQVHRWMRRYNLDIQDFRPR